MPPENIEPPAGLSGTETPKGRRICAWCKKDLGPAETEEDTHGMCDECKTKAFAQLAELKAEKEEAPAKNPPAEKE
ncbi:MAG: hypothetical protein HY433_01805 [Candidatus Liptonbacteria bacterium]|nr:hypothetical protein [Candidatus Liptonbacteria bacterium]